MCEGGCQARLCACGPWLDPALDQTVRPGLDPSLRNPVAVRLCRGEPAAQLNLTAIQQASNPQRRGLFCAVKAVLLKGEPGELGVGDHPAGERPNEQLADRHDFCNGTLRVCLIWAAAVAPQCPTGFCLAAPTPRGDGTPLQGP